MPLRTQPKIFLAIHWSLGMEIFSPMALSVSGSATLQQYLNDVGDAYPSIPLLAVDGKFGVQTQNAVMMFQHLFDLKVDGVVGEKTWNISSSSGKKLFDATGVIVRAGI